MCACVIDKCVKGDLRMRKVSPCVRDLRFLSDYYCDGFIHKQDIL